VTRDPQDPLGPRHAEDRGTFFVADFEKAGRAEELKPASDRPRPRPRMQLPDPAGHDPLGVPLEDADFDTYSHRAPLRIHGELHDPTVHVPYRARGEAQVRDGGPVSHRKPRRVDWVTGTIQGLGVASVVGAGYLFWVAWRASQAAAQAARDAAATNLLPVIVPDPMPLAATVGVSLVFALGGLLLLVFSVLHRRCCCGGPK
jgi:hypothetical protein